MTQAPDKQRRRSIRLHGYDYAQAGAYFVTIVMRDRACLFGEVVNGEMRPNQFGRIVQSTWGELPDHYAGVECDAFMVMPNHVHGIIVLADEGGVVEIIRGFKTFSARRINELSEHPVCRFGNAIITNTSFVAKTNCTASGNISRTIRYNGR